MEVLTKIHEYCYWENSFKIFIKTTEVLKKKNNKKNKNNKKKQSKIMPLEDHKKPKHNQIRLLEDPKKIHKGLPPHSGLWL